MQQQLTNYYLIITHTTTTTFLLFFKNKNARWIWFVPAALEDHGIRTPANYNKKNLNLVGNVCDVRDQWHFHDQPVAQKLETLLR